MLDKIWMGMIIVSFLCASVMGNMEKLSMAITDGADKGVQLIISMAGMMCLWSGMMKIAEKSSFTKIISRLLSPVLLKLMPDYDKNSPAMQAVGMNITANILGLGNAATPFGITAMREMQKHNILKDQPNKSMIMFVVINTASVQLIPTTTAALRKAAGSTDPYLILPYVWAASLAALLVGIITARICSLKN